MNQAPHRVPEAHALVAETAAEFANGLYEQYARDNAFYKRFPEGKGRRRFVERVAPRFLPEARAVLAKMLTMDYPDDYKVKIYEALQLDSTLTRGRMTRAEAIAAVKAMQTNDD